MQIIEMSVERETQVQNRFNPDEMDDVSVNVDIEIEIINTGSVRHPEFEIQNAYEIETGNEIDLEPSERMIALNRAYDHYLNNQPDMC